MFVQIVLILEFPGAMWAGNYLLLMHLNVLGVPTFIPHDLPTVWAVVKLPDSGLLLMNLPDMPMQMGFIRELLVTKITLVALLPMDRHVVPQVTRGLKRFMADRTGKQA